MALWRDLARRGLAALVGGQTLALPPRDTVTVERLPPEGPDDHTTPSAAAAEPTADRKEPSR